MKFAFIAAQKASYSVTRMCRWLGVSRCGYYAWCARPEAASAATDRRLAVDIAAVFTRSRRTYGSPRIVAELRATGTAVGRRRVRRLMRENGLIARSKRRFVKPCQDVAASSFAHNALNREFDARRPDQRWVADTTEFWLPQGRVFLAVLLDLYSRKVVGWATSPVNNADLVVRALDNALVTRRPAGPLLHHSDRGSPYASWQYQKRLAACGIATSMSRPGNCYDNAVAEAFFSTLKTEMPGAFDSLADANRRLFDYIEVFYNQQRRHSALGYLAPAEYERTFSRELRAAA